MFGNGSVVAIASIPTRLFPGSIREPDQLCIAPENRPDGQVEYPSHLDLAMEIVSKGSEARKRDYEDKVRDYAKAGIADYWIVDPQEAKVTVFVLADVGESKTSPASVDDGSIKWEPTGKIRIIRVSNRHKPALVRSVENDVRTVRWNRNRQLIGTGCF